MHYTAPRIVATVFLAVVFLGSFATSPAHSESDLIGDAKRVVFLGDSITYSGQYIAYLDAYLRVTQPDRKVQLLNVGLPSETVSGQSEPGHASGRFPRPDLHERLDRILLETKPDLVIACYGMNCGIYHPYSHERFQAFRDGIVRLRSKAIAAGTRVIHITPPTFDPHPILDRTIPAGEAEYRQMYRGYNEVLDLYSAWLLAQRGRGWQVIDAHGPMNEHLANKRKTDPEYRLAKDGVHMNAIGHWLLAREVLRSMHAPESVLAANSANEMMTALGKPKEVIDSIQKRQRMESNWWLNKAGHLRPGMAAAKPADEFEKLTSELNDKINDLLK